MITVSVTTFTIACLVVLVVGAKFGKRSVRLEEEHAASEAAKAAAIQQAAIERAAKRKIALQESNDRAAKMKAARLAEQQTPEYQRRERLREYEAKMFFEWDARNSAGIK